MTDSTSLASAQDGGPTQASRGGRREFILERLREGGQVDVNDIARTFGVSGMTIRRDLAELDAEGLIRRVHGGATGRPPTARRAMTMSEEKVRIARVVRQLITPGDTVGIDAGTTCTAVANQLAMADGILAVTNSLFAALEFENSNSSVIVLGGQMTPEATLVSGELLERRELHLDSLILGCGGITTTGISYFDLAETNVRKSLVDISDRVIMAVDHSKIGLQKPIVLGSLDLLDVLVTSDEPAYEFRSALDKASVELIIARD